MAKGAPTKYRQEYAQKLIKHMSQGFSFESFAGLIGVYRQTIYNWRDPDHGSFQKEFLDAFKKGKQKSLLFYEKHSHNVMRGTKAGQKASVPMTIWKMTNMHRDVWRNDKDQASEPSAPNVQIVGGESFDKDE